MKNIFTYGIFLFFLLGIGNNVSANLVKSAGTSIAGLDWTNTAAWALGVAPTPTDSVQIMGTDSISISSEVGCVSLQVDGTVLVGGKLHVNGGILVNASATFDLNTASMYCLNITNKGRFWAKGYTGSSSSPRGIYLGCGFTVTGSVYTLTYPVGDYSIVNDGRFGDFRTRAFANSVAGSGISVFYNGFSNSVTIGPSTTSTTPIAFNISQILPISGQTTANSLALNINESIGLAKYSSSPCFSLENGENFTGTRTCNIAALDTVYIAGSFHVRGSAPSPSVGQGNMIYNVNGILDFAVGTSNTTNELDLFTSALSPYVALNINSGGTLILGKALKLVASAATGQTILFNPAAGSTVIFGQPTGLTTATPITITNTSLPSSFDNFIINNILGVAVTMSGTAAQTFVGGNTPISGLIISNSTPGSVSLTSSLRVRNVLALTSGNITLGSSNLIAGSISGGSATSYVVTSGTGVLSTNATTLGTLFPIGTTAGYAPATITPASNDTVSAQVSATPTGAYTGYTINANEWTLTPQIATTATLGLMPTATINTAAPIIFSGILAGSYTTTTSATLTSGTYTASGITLPASATPVATGGSPVTAIQSNTNNNLLIYSTKNSLVVRNATVGDLVTVYGVSGIRVASSVVKSDNTTVTLTPGIYIVKAGSTIQKVSVQ
jgi:hypothetical protein